MEIFQPITYAKINFKNRILRAATAECMADESGKLTQDLLKKIRTTCKKKGGGSRRDYHR